MPSPNVFAAVISGTPLSGTDYNDNWALAESSLLSLGSWVVSGLTLSAGTGLSVNVAAGSAVIGAEVTASGSFTIAGLTPSSTCYLYLQQDGTGTSNTSGTQPANTAFLGIAVTGSSTVSSVSIAGRPATVPFRDTSGHLLLTGGSAPTAAAGANAGTSPPSPIVNSGNDTRGSISFGTGSSPAAGAMVSVSFAQPYAAAPYVIAIPQNAATALLGLYITGNSTTGFVASLAAAPAAGQANTTYAFAFLCVG